jgi:hypothetical protein
VNRVVEFLTFPVVLPMWFLVAIVALTLVQLAYLGGDYARNALAVVRDVSGVRPQRHGGRHGRPKGATDG